MPAFVAVTAWYLIVGSVLMVGQYYGRYFRRGGPAESRGQGHRKSASRRAGDGRCLMSDVSTSGAGHVTARGSRSCAPSTS